MIAPINPVAVRRHFRRVAATYAEADFLAREVDARLQSRLEYLRLAPEVIVDLGCGPALSRLGLLARYPGARYVGLDQEAAMFAPAAQSASPAHFLAASAERLPLRAGVAGLVWSNLLLPWLADPFVFFQEVRRVLAEGGLFMFSALGPDTLKELRGSFPDGHAHTQEFQDMHHLGDMLLEAGLADPVLEMEILTLTYPDLETLLAELRAAGATRAMRGGPPGLSGKAFLRGLKTHYESLRREGRLPVTMEILYGHAWQAAPRVPPHLPHAPHAPQEAGEAGAILRFVRNAGRSGGQGSEA
ncbi:MAG: methyltransferase domain-containing protein [Zoogloeaceae bacterium]|jgi:malonyl-CoA O-methyltransferase|nr:methyltransferase domain-containing protein [Zoogloeaceae bacterium]